MDNYEDYPHPCVCGGILERFRVDDDVDITVRHTPKKWTVRCTDFDCEGERVDGLPITR